MYLRNLHNELVALPRCVLFASKTLPTSHDQLIECVKQVRLAQRWAVLIYSGGRFAGAIFDGRDVVVHKTLRRYTVRAGQGGGQFKHEQQRNTGASAGSRLRRHGEASIRSDVANLLHNQWRIHLQSCQLICLWAAKSSRSIFFTAPSPSTASPSSPSTNTTESSLAINSVGFKSDDLRLRLIGNRLGANATTYEGIKQIHQQLSTFEVYDATANLELLRKSGKKQLESGLNTLHITKSGRLIHGPADLPLMSERVKNRSSSSLSSLSSSNDRSEDSLTSSSSEEEQDVENVANNSPPVNKTSGNLNGDKQCDSSTSSIAATTADKPTMSAGEKRWYRQMFMAVASGYCDLMIQLVPPNMPRLHCPLLPSSPTSSSSKASFTADNHGVNNGAKVVPSEGSSKTSLSPTESQPLTVDSCLRLLNTCSPAGNGGGTLLHRAVELQPNVQVVALLLQLRCDPTLVDSSNRTPYQLASMLRRKACLKLFAQFRRANPDAYDYGKAKIPLPTIAVSKPSPKKTTNRNKPSKSGDKPIATIVDGVTAKTPTKSAITTAPLPPSNDPVSKPGCVNCGASLVNKVPFTYLDFKLCSPACLKAHRSRSKK